jgi:glucose-1-phosphate thymidylyltransferase
MQRKAIILAGGSGTRLRPITSAINKHLVPVYDKPMIMYSLSTVMLAGTREVLVVTNPGESELFQRLIGDGERFGMRISYAVQDRPAGLPDAFIVGRKFLDGAPCIMTLGDNLFHGHGLQNHIAQGVNSQGASVFLFYVQNPRPYGVAVLNATGEVEEVVEKPRENMSNFAISGLYMFDERATEIARSLSPSHRGELEIVDMIRHYLREGSLNVIHCGRGTTWMDMGTADRLLAASNYVQLIEKHSNLKVGVPEEIAWRRGWIDDRMLANSAQLFAGTAYGDYLDMLPDAPRFS